MCAPVEIKTWLHTSNGSETLKSQTSYSHDVYKSSFTKSATGFLHVPGRARSLRKRDIHPRHVVGVLDSRQPLPSPKREHG